MGGNYYSGDEDDQNKVIKGATDGTEIGNVGDRLKVDASFSSPVTSLPSWSCKLRYNDMNVSTGGVARDTSIATSTTWTQVYSYSGSGYIAGLLLNLETFTGWEMRLVVDSDTIFSFVDSDLTTDKIYDVDNVTDVHQASLGISKGSHDRFIWSAPLDIPMYFSATIVVQVRRPTAGAKKFQAGLITHSKET